MAISSKIKIMISSRCKDRFPLSQKTAKELSIIRSQIKKKIESIKIFNKTIYEAWINEDETEDSSQTAWTHCINQAKSCDIFISIFNGNAGWTDYHGTTGICHAEFMMAYNTAPGKVFIINISEPNDPNFPNQEHDKHFQNYLKILKRFDVRASADELNLISAVTRTVRDSTVKLVQRGVRDASRGNSYVGPALDWSRQSYIQRTASMKEAALAGMARGGTSIDDSSNLVQQTICGKRLLFVVNAIPDAMSVSAAREIVGQPHLQDHIIFDKLKKVDGGPVHIVVCHKTVTESQAIRMLGFPNATIVSAPFGIYVVCPVQSIQLVLIAQCRDETTTRHGVQRFLEWLDESEQASELKRHAAKRKVVVKALALHEGK
jgi:hypothetical protein